MLRRNHKNYVIISSKRRLDELITQCYHGYDQPMSSTRAKKVSPKYMQ